MRIGDLSRRTGVSIRMLRYYEAEGLMTPVRTASGYRDYAPDDETTVTQIRTLGRTGMTLAEIKDFLPCTLNGRDAFEPCDELKASLRARINRLDGQVRDLRGSRKLLARMLAAFEASTP